jgi:hypothetical protein
MKDIPTNDHYLNRNTLYISAPFGRAPAGSGFSTVVLL